MSLGALDAEPAALGNVRAVIDLVCWFIVKKAQEAKVSGANACSPGVSCGGPAQDEGLMNSGEVSGYKKRRAVLSLPRLGPLFNAGSDASFHLHDDCK
jgi:hypothetical protein